MSACHQLWAHRAVGTVGNAIVALIVLAVGIFMLWQGVPGLWAWGLIIGAIAALGLSVLREVMWRRYYRSLTKYTAPISATFDETGVGVASAEGENHVRWAKFRHHVLTRDFMLLLLDNRQFSVLPIAEMRAAANHADIEELVKARTKPLKSRMF